MRTRNDFVRHTAVAGLALLIAAGQPGCRIHAMIRDALGMDGQYLLYGFDALTTPGKPALLNVRLQKGSYLTDQEERLVRAFYDNRFVAQAHTDDEGLAAMTFTPPGTGNYLLSVGVPEDQIDGQDLDPVPLLVACRAPDEPIAVIDIDKTLVKSDFRHVLADKAQPMPDSLRVMQKLGRNNTIIYLTFRPDHLGPKTAGWLREHQYPVGPLWVSRFDELLDGNREYRKERIRKLRQRFPNVQLGIGDKISDAEAYLANEMTTILIVHLDELVESDDRRDLAEELRELPDQVRVVKNWREIEAAVFEKTPFPPARIINELVGPDRTRTQR